MSLTSIDFYYFFAAVLFVCVFVPRRLVWIPLLVASYAFYAASQPFGILFLVAQTLITYAASRFMANTLNPRWRGFGFCIGLIFVLGMLVILKYADFAGRSIAGAIGRPAVAAGARTISTWTPLGLSFFTFANASYIIDVWNNRVSVDRHLGRVALLGAFFPQVVSGPIPRAAQLLPQFSSPHRPSESRLRSGSILLLWGLFKKLVIADRLANYVNPVYGDLHAWNGPTLALASLFFTFQIYCDFSGYTDIAIGVARILGIDLMLNFRQPYLAKSIGEFWHRWHISLSTWFRDYLYIPLGGSRVALPRWMLNVLLVFVISGLWHGANWTYIAWGGLHGVYLIVGRVTSTWRDLAWRSVRMEWLRGSVSRAVTFALVCFAWIFFRSSSVHDAFFVVAQLPHALNGLPWQGDSQLSTIMSILVILVLIAVESLQFSGLISDERLPGFRWPLPVRWAAYVCLILSIFLLGVSSNGFIYGKF